MIEAVATAPAGPTDTIVFSNVTVVRDQEGNLSVWVGSEKMMGVSAVQIQGGVLSLAMPMTRARLAENNPATPVVVPNDNVVSFTKFRAMQATKTIEDSPTTDGDSA